MKLWQKLTLALAGVAIVAVLAVGYMGFLPVVSDVMGTNKPVDLGVKYTAKDTDSATGKLGDFIASAPVKKAEVTLTEAELTAVFNEIAAKQPEIPLRDAQIGVDEGVVEVSAKLDMQKIRDLAERGKLSESERKLIDTITATVKTDPSVYVKMSVETLNGEVRVDLKTMKIGQVPLPLDQMGVGENVVEGLIEQLRAESGVNVEALKAVNGALTISSKLTPP